MLTVHTVIVWVNSQLWLTFTSVMKSEMLCSRDTNILAVLEIYCYVGRYTIIDSDYLLTTCTI